MSVNDCVISVLLRNLSYIILTILVNQVIKLDEIKREIEKREEELKNLKSEALLKIEALEKEEYKNVLILKYFNHLNWDEIAKKIFSSRSTVKRWHNEALEAMEV